MFWKNEVPSTNTFYWQVHPVVENLERLTQPGFCGSSGNAMGGGESGKEGGGGNGIGEEQQGMGS